jgi:hypothetical protein
MVEAGGEAHGGQRLDLHLPGVDNDARLSCSYGSPLSYPHGGGGCRVAPRFRPHPSTHCRMGYKYLTRPYVRRPTLFSSGGGRTINKSTFFTWALSSCRRYFFSLPRLFTNGWTGIFLGSHDRPRHLLCVLDLSPRTEMWAYKSNNTSPCRS